MEICEQEVILEAYTSIVPLRVFFDTFSIFATLPFLTLLDKHFF